MERRETPKVNFPWESYYPSEHILILDLIGRCSCIHGGRCSCALKKEHLDLVLESDPDKNSTSTVPANEIRHPHALTPQSQNPLTVFASDHMQGHKYTEMTQTRRLSYVDPEAHATYDETPFGSTNHSIDCLPQLNTVDTFHGDPQIEDSTVSLQQGQRMASSEFGSSALGSSSNLGQLDSLLPPINPSSLDNFTGLFDNSLNFDNFDTILEIDQLFFPADLGSLSNDWSQYDI